MIEVGLARYDAISRDQSSKTGTPRRGIGAKGLPSHGGLKHEHNDDYP
jgi:hypothetical protein